MYKLTIIAGPNRGASFPVSDGEVTLGRQAGNSIVLSSPKVSKRHVALIVTAEGVVMKDQGSSNGTFVNGVLAKQRVLRPGDRISVGDFVLELSKPASRPSVVPVAVAGLGAPLQVPGISLPAVSGLEGVAPSSGVGDLNSGTGAIGALGGNTPPADWKGKVLFYFEKHVMPMFYGLNLKQEWRTIGVGLFAAFVVGNLLISVYPLLESSRATIVKETGRRAQFMARQLVERNSAALAAGAETRTEIGSIEKEDGVRLALLTDLDNRIIAPGSRMNQYLTSGAEATFAIRARDAFRKGHESGFVREIDSSTIVAIEPVKVLSPREGKNVVRGMAIVSIDTSLATPDFGEMGVVYSETLILTGLLGGLILLILYRLTLKPFEVLNDEIDKVLKGDMSQITREFKFSELTSLLDVIGAALQRVSKGGGDGLGMGGPAITGEDFVAPLRAVGDAVKTGLMICDGDRRILYMNAVFEEMSGIRAENAVGQDVPSVARDQSFGAFVGDLFDRSMPGGAAVVEDYEFSGISYKVHAAAFGPGGAGAKAYLLAAVKAEG